MVGLEHHLHRRRLAVFGLHLVQADVLVSRIPADEDAGHAIDGYLQADNRLVLLVDPAQDIHAGRAVVVLRFHRRELLGLADSRDHRLLVHGGNHGHACRDRHHHAHSDGLVPELRLAIAHVIGADRQGHERPHDDERDHHMRIACQRAGIEGRGEEIREHRLRPVGRQLVARGRLHPAVRDDDPQRAQAASRPHKPTADQVEPLSHAPSAEDDHSEERALQEEREKRLGRERRAEDIAHEATVIGPIGAEAEFHGDARGHTHRESHSEELHPESRSGLILLRTASIRLRLEDGHDEAHANRKRNEHEVIGRGERKLQARQQHNVHANLLSPLKYRSRVKDSNL